MATDVYANSNEIASKSARGSSRMAFPDVCHTPPATAAPTPIKPFPPGVPVPYPNTCFAPDITNGSRTVFILGKEIALEDFSYFSTSTGDEAATMGLAKGIRSGAITGRAHFKSWSPNVKVEGRGVARHLDWVSHNHTNPPNVLQRQYISGRMPSTECNGDRRAIERACPEKPNRPENRQSPPPRPRRRSFKKSLANLASLPDDSAKKTLGYNRRHGGSNSWLDDYCSGLWIKPVSGSKAWDDYKENLDKLFDVLELDATAIAQNVMGELVEMAYERLGKWFLVRKLGGLAARSVLKNIVGAAAGATGIGLAVTGAMATWTIVDAINTAKEIAEALGPEGMDHLEDLLDLETLKKEATEKIDEYRKKPAKFLTDLMRARADTNPCTRARRCMLVPYGQTEFPENTDGKGCCPGQTGHHLIPGAVFEKASCYSEAKHKQAPTMCLEGTGNVNGSHGAAHQELKRLLTDSGIPNGNPITYEEVKSLSLDAINIVAPHCDRKCLAAQLDQFYTDCRNSNQLQAHDGIGGKSAQTTPLPNPATPPRND